MPWAPAGRDGGGARDAVLGGTGNGALRKRTIMQEKAKLCLLLPYQSSVMPINDAVVCVKLPHPQDVGGLALHTGSNWLWTARFPVVRATRPRTSGCRINYNHNPAMKSSSEPDLIATWDWF